MCWESSISVTQPTTFTDCRQITFVTLNGICPLSNPLPTSHPLPLTLTPLFLTDKSKINRIPTKVKLKNTYLFHSVFQVLNVLLIKFVRYSHQIFYFFLFLLAFALAGIIFLKILESELHSKTSEKNIVLNFPLLRDLLRPPTPLTAKIC